MPVYCPDVAGMVSGCFPVSPSGCAGIRIARELLEPVTAKKVVSKIGSAIFSLEEFPQRNSLVTDERLALQGIRKIIVDNFIVFYVIDEENKFITIVRILYAKRDWMNLL